MGMKSLGNDDRFFYLELVNEHKNAIHEAMHKRLAQSVYLNSAL